MSAKNIVMAAAGVGGAADTDPQFENVILLLHGDGTNGGQNNTFIDGSTNNFTITRNGNTTQGTFSPYGTLWSNYNPDSNNGIEVASNTALNMGTGDFTVEAWVNTAKLPTTNNFQSSSGGYQCVFGTGPNNSATGSQLYIGVTNLKFDIASDGSGPIDVAHNMVAGQWYHIAITRSGTTFRAFINGALVQTATGISTSWVDGYAWGIMRSESISGFSGAWWYGYVSNFRVVKGTALYTSAFTPSTAPLTAITNTSLLTCQSNRFIDNSSNNITINRNGNVSVQRFSPFNPPAAYSAATIGGSGYFDGSGDWLTAGNNSAFAFGTGDFCVEAFVYVPSFSGIHVLFDTRTSGTDSAGMSFGFNSSGELFAYSGTSFVIQVGAPAPNAWNHVAFVRSGTTLTVYLNGSSVGSATVSTNFTSNNSVVGKTNESSSNFFNGYISSLRVVKGSAVYTGNFTPPSSPLTAITNTGLLLNFTNAAIFDNAMICNVETVANAQISTSVKKFGTASLRNPATTTGEGFKALTNGLFLNGDFTIEWWAYHDNLNTGSNHVMLGPWGMSSNPILVRIDNGSTLQVYMAAGGPYLSAAVGSSGITATTWQHYAITRSNGTCRFFVSGTQVGSSWTLSTALNMSVVSLMCENAGISGPADQMPGYMDDVRLTNGVARYTSNFTPPAAPFLDR